MTQKVLNVVGARPNFMKIAPLMAEFARHPEFEAQLLHTGQHYDAAMSKLFFEELGIPKPEIDLGVGSSSHAIQTGRIMIEFEQVLLDSKPDLVVVVGDVNSTVACSLVAVKLGIKVAHVEAGLRSFDRTMPEEINRILTDQISDYLFVTEGSGETNLLREGIAKEKIHFVGNVMIDTLLQHLEKARESAVLQDLKLTPKNYVALTLHRPANVDSATQFSAILDALEQVQKEIALVFPMHPRSLDRLQAFGLRKRMQALSNLIVTEPLGYLDFLQLLAEARFVLTDSGGVQEETTVLGVPCLTLRESTERPVTVTDGTNLVIGTEPARIVEESKKILAGNVKRGRQPALWDGGAAGRIVNILSTRP